MRTIAWSPRVGEVWSGADGTVEVVGEHAQARLVLVKDTDGEREWMPVADLEEQFEQERCVTCGVPLTAMRKMLIEEAKRNASPTESGLLDAIERLNETLDRRDREIADLRLLVETPEPTRYAWGNPGEYCTKPCCATRRAPKTC